MRPFSLLLAALISSFAAAGCSSCGSGSTGPSPSASSSAAPSPSDSSLAVPSKPRAPAPSRQGNVVARGAEEDVLYVADEDASAIHLVPLPFEKDKPTRTVALPGRPAQVLPLADKVLVTIRDPGLLLVMRPDAAAGLVEASRVAVPDDAWGIAISRDEKLAFVTSAWTHAVTAVDLSTSKVRSTSDVGREPRGIVLLADGARAYVSHLVGSSLTRIDGIDTDKPKVTRVLLPPAPLRMEFEPKRRDDASLGYSLTLSPDERRLYVARHALGAWGTEMWFGSPTVDVLLTKDDSPLAPMRKAPGVGMNGSFGAVEDAVLTMHPSAFVQPRALVYRRSANTVLVIGEGTGVVEELDALSMDPTVMKRRTTVLFDDATRVMCAAPSGLALSSDERIAYVFCRANNVLSVVRYGALEATGKPDVTNYSLGEGPKDAAVAAGRKLYYDATDTRISGGLSCAGCHPDGRDDGFTWSEGTEDDINQRTFLADFSQSPNGGVGFPRQTPMLAGRVSAPGPYGWHGESEDLTARVLAGFRLHRWMAFTADDEVSDKSNAVSIAAFVRRGLVPPPRSKGELSDAAKRGKTLFESAEVGCKSCHSGAEYTDRVAVPIPRFGLREGFADEALKNYKTPSLLFVGGTAPYFHDGSAATLEALVEKNDDRMGKTSQLSADDKAALVAYLRTL